MDDLRFGISKKGMVVLAGLSPEETFELEQLVFQNDPASEARLRVLFAKHWGAAEEPTSEGRAYLRQQGR
jgi:hypothetical protein